MSRGNAHGSGDDWRKFGGVATPGCRNAPALLVCGRRGSPVVGQPESRYRSERGAVFVAQVTVLGRLVISSQQCSRSGQAAFMTGLLTASICLVVCGLDNVHTRWKTPSAAKRTTCWRTGAPLISRIGALSSCHQSSVRRCVHHDAPDRPGAGPAPSSQVDATGAESRISECTMALMREDPQQDPGPQSTGQDALLLNGRIWALMRIMNAMIELAPDPRFKRAVPLPSRRHGRESDGRRCRIS